MFNDRVEAGRQLATKLLEYVGKDVLVLAIPRGGVVVGYEVAHRLKAPLDITAPRKIGAPGNPELAIGALAEDGTLILDQRLVEYLGVSENYIKEEVERQLHEIKRRLHMYRGDRPYPNLKGKTVIVVDDGIATGATMMAAIASIRKKGAKKIVVAIPVAPPSALNKIRSSVDQLICLYAPEPFFAVGQFYRIFDQTSDEEVISLLERNREEIEKFHKK